MKKLISILFILTLCLMAITAPAMAQLTFQSESQSQSEEVEVADDEMLDDTPVTEAEIENARMMLEMVAKRLTLRCPFLPRSRPSPSAPWCAVDRKSVV